MRCIDRPTAPAPSADCRHRRHSEPPYAAAYLGTPMQPLMTLAAFESHQARRINDRGINDSSAADLDSFFETTLTDTRQPILHTFVPLEQVTKSAHQFVHPSLIHYPTHPRRRHASPPNHTPSLLPPNHESRTTDTELAAAAFPAPESPTHQRLCPPSDHHTALLQRASLTAQSGEFAPDAALASSSYRIACPPPQLLHQPANAAQLAITLHQPSFPTAPDFDHTREFTASTSLPRNRPLNMNATDMPKPSDMNPAQADDSILQTHTYSRRSILIILPVAPWPARFNGISIRYYPIIESLSKRHNIDLFVHSEPRDSIPTDVITQHIRRSHIQHLCALPPTIRDRTTTLLESLSPVGQPYRFARYNSARIRNSLLEFCSNAHYDSVLWVMHEYRSVYDKVMPHISGERFLYDSIDSPYLHHLRELSALSNARPWQRYDLWKTRRWERTLTDGLDGIAYISTPDAQAAAPHAKTRTVIIPNGIYLAGEPTDIPSRGDAPSIGFLGNMAYPPNIVGAIRLHKKIFSPLKREIARLRLMIIGRDPDSSILSLEAPDVEITGTVPLIWPHIANVSVFVYPMTSGAGLQNKILEAMHAGKPVVTTEICAESLGAQEGREILVGRSDRELLSHTRDLLMNPEYARNIGLQGKSYADRTFDMPKVVRLFEEFLLPNDA